MSQNYVHTNVYGGKAYSIFAAASYGSELLAFSADSPNRLNYWHIDTAFMPPLYNVDNEVLLISLGRQNDVKEVVTDHVIRLYEELKRIYKEDETFYLVHQNTVHSAKKSKGILNDLKKNLSNRTFSACSRSLWLCIYPSIKLSLVPLKLSDFEEVISDLKRPSSSGRLDDQFSIEMRRALMNAFGGASRFFSLKYFYMFDWIMQSKLAKEDMKTIFKGNKDIIEWSKTKECDDFIEAANKLKEIDWMDPALIAGKILAYNNRWHDFNPVDVLS